MMSVTESYSGRITRWELKIRSKYNNLKNGERMVADTVLRVREKLLEYSIAALAAESGVSEPTVVRFCHSVGYQGIKDLKLSVAEEKSNWTQLRQEPSLAGKDADDIEVYSSHIMSGCVAALRDTLTVLDFTLLHTAVEKLSSAENLDIIGVGGSAPVAILAQHNFRKMGLRVCTYESVQQNYLMVERFRPGDVVLAVSQSGETPEVVQAARVAKEKGAFIIAVTDMHESSLGEIANVKLCSFCRAEVPMGDNTYSRMAQLGIIDILYAGVCKKRMEDRSPVIVE